MDQKQYIFNRETTKIELHFDKADYDALQAEQKNKLKSSFLWSNYGKCWVSRAKEPNLYTAKKVAKELGFTDEERTGERLSFAEQVERKAERAEERADRYETYADNAEHRAEVMQKPLNAMHGDIAFFTQPIIAGHAGSQAFARRRQKMFDRHDKGFEEYRKSEYFRERAETARDTASTEKFKDAGYLDRRIKEVQKEIKHRTENIIHYEELLYAIENGEEKKRYSGEVITNEEVSGWLDRELELVEVAQDKEGYYLNCLDEIGGVKFSQENIKPGYIVKLSKWGNDVNEVVSTGKINIKYKSGISGLILTAAYAEIEKVIKEVEQKKEPQPWKVGDEFTCKVYTNLKTVTKTFKVIKASDCTITLQAGEEKPFIRRPTKAKYTNEDQWMVSITDHYEGTFYKKVLHEQSA